ARGVDARPARRPSRDVTDAATTSGPLTSCDETRLSGPPDLRLAEVLHHAELVGRLVARRLPEVDGGRPARGAHDQVHTAHAARVQVLLRFADERGRDAAPAMRGRDREAIERAAPAVPTGDD